MYDHSISEKNVVEYIFKTHPLLVMAPLYWLQLCLYAIVFQMDQPPRLLRRRSLLIPRMLIVASFFELVTLQVFRQEYLQVFRREFPQEFPRVFLLVSLLVSRHHHRILPQRVQVLYP